MAGAALQCRGRRNANRGMGFDRLLSPPRAHGNRWADMSKCVKAARKSSVAVLLSRLFLEMSPSARTSKGFLIVGTRVTQSMVQFNQAKPAECCATIFNLMHSTPCRQALFRRMIQQPGVR